MKMKLYLLKAHAARFTALYSLCFVYDLNIFCKQYGLNIYILRRLKDIAQYLKRDSDVIK